MQFIFSLGRIGIAGSNIARPSFDDLIGDFAAAVLFKRPDDLENRISVAGAEVESIDPLVAANPCNGRKMSFCEVNDVDVIPHAGSVGGIVVVSVDRKMVKLSAGDPCDIGQKIIRNAVRLFTDQSRRMCADRIEIPKKRDCPIFVRYTEIA